MPARTRRVPGGRDELSRLLVTLRGDKTQGEAGALIGVNQSRISRAESGRGGLTAEQADAYAQALGASRRDRNRLVQLVRTFEAGSITTRTTLVRKAPEIQARIEKLYRESTAIRSWQPEIIPGAAQTRGYTLAVVAPMTPGPAWWTPRQARIDMLGEPGRTFHFLISEAALRWGIGSREVMAEQMQHLDAVSRLRGVRLGVVPLDVVHPVAPPSAFELYGSRTASVATLSGTAFVEDRPDIERYEEDFNALADLARYDDDARALFGSAWS
jgi:transcriptional regulator with XRE-family HTH domain